METTPKFLEFCLLDKTHNYLPIIFWNQNELFKEYEVNQFIRRNTLIIKYLCKVSCFYE